MIVIKVFSKHPYIRSLLPDELEGRVCKVQPDGSGNLIFPHAKRPTSVYEDGTFSAGRPPRKQRIGFYRVPNVKAVDDLIRQTFEAKE